MSTLRGQWKVEWIETNPGLQDFVRSANIVVPWKQRKTSLREESNWQLLREASEATWPGHEHLADDAVTSALEATGEHVSCYRSGVLPGDSDALQRIGARAHLTIEVGPPACVDHNGVTHLPFQQGVSIAKAFAKAEPDVVLAYIASEEEQSEQSERIHADPSILLMHDRYRAGWGTRSAVSRLRRGQGGEGQGDRAASEGHSRPRAEVAQRGAREFGGPARTDGAVTALISSLSLGFEAVSLQMQRSGVLRYRASDVLRKAVWIRRLHFNRNLNLSSQ